MVAVCEVDIVFVENCGPLERSRMELLASMAMAILRVQGLLPAQLILDLAAMTAALIANFEVWIGVVHAVWSPVFPGVELALCTAIVSVVTVGSVC